MAHDGVTTSSPLRRSRRIKMNSSLNKTLSPQLKAASRSSDRRRRGGVTEGSSHSSSTAAPMVDHHRGEPPSSQMHEERDSHPGPRSIKGEPTKVKTEPPIPPRTSSLVTGGSMRPPTPRGVKSRTTARPAHGQNAKGGADPIETQGSKGTTTH